ncbi:hypothetical protein [Salinigranum halophilum]|uniref:hypothetical protein n=1 Tax=Salinigranum halophilum TaxID=2565931 RepID=UPI00115CF8C0|nr:hypothetical protein [Salinigranum halophilum]
MLNQVLDTLGQLALIDVVQLLLLLVTIVISGVSFLSQKRAGIRESLEQLAPVYGPMRISVRPLLHRVSFVPPRSDVSLKLHPSVHLNEATRQTTVRHLLSQKNGAELRSALDEIDGDHGVRDYELVQDEVRLKICSVNAVKVRRVVSRVLLYFEHDFRADTLDDDFEHPELEERFL